MLNIHISSFPYAKGVPSPPHNHGCGFVFDCRGIENPGLLPQLAIQTGLDKEVQHFLLETTKMPSFLSAVNSLIYITVEKYLERGFSDLSINFGCTGGRHRSVFAAESTAHSLRQKYGKDVNVTINHTTIQVVR